ncbi:MAG: bifunctional phosphoribosylaminoimidazolecarboxamide formyltransferase/IMP cyclohydrolase [Chloroflexota bacterium]|nr:bifunctional phosphoribosylaminoimidazolecarboxamide formyltransferase/IMP cyclohydrolase [Chloroflexota bacterium]
MQAILSVSDKTGLVEFAQGLSELGVSIYSTGGTKGALQKAGVPVHSVGDLTNFPEILDGRVKTLHPAVHGGILAKRNVPGHLAELKEKGIGTIDLVAVNLYPFVQTVSREGVTIDEALENIDIGGPTMIRAAAKNFPSVLVVVDPADYGPVLEMLRSGDVPLEDRKRLAQKAFQHVALYDTAIASYLRPKEDRLPVEMTIALSRIQELSYGENPHQQAAFYRTQVIGQEKSGVVAAAQLSGKALSFNNILDLDAALSIVGDFATPTVAILKHNNPCGLASHDDLAEAYRRALTGDPVSAFGGIVATNRKIDQAAAEEISKTHFDAIVAPEFDEAALSLLKRKKGLRLLSVGSIAESKGVSAMNFRHVGGGFLLQSADVEPETLTLRTVTNREPTEAELEDLRFGWRAVKHVKSNAIVLAKDHTLLGMGAGQPSRVDSVEIALKKAGDRAKGSALASDAFFPFPDGVELAAKGGVTAIIEPGGSVRDEEVIKVANEHNIAMVFTGVRHFKH